MAKALTFDIGGVTFSAEPVKVERKKLYGWQEKIAFDENGKLCQTAYADNSGAFILPAGGVGQGIFTEEGAWVERSSLAAFNADGSPAELKPSSYGGVINLDTAVPPETFLNYTVTAVYFLGADVGLVSAVGEHIFTFQYCYRDSYETQTAFVLANDTGAFMLVGYDAGFELLEMKQEAVIDEDGADLEENDELDFAFI
jgi:hypothetical protein